MSAVTRYLAVAVVAFVVAWIVQGWRADAEIADLKRDAAVTAQRLAVESAQHTNAVLQIERRYDEVLAQKEEAYVELSGERARLLAENERLSGDLGVAFERLRRIGARPAAGGGVPAAAEDAGGCQAVRAARDTAVAAMERLVARGRAIVEQGHDGVDVATLATRAAREYAEYPGAVWYGSRGPQHAQADGTTVGAQPAAPPESTEVR